METNNLTVRIDHTEFNGAIKLRADEFQMHNVAALRLILTKPDAEHETYDILESTVLVEPLTGILKGVADYTFSVIKKEIAVANTRKAGVQPLGTKALEIMARRGVHYILGFQEPGKMRQCTFKLKRVEWNDNNRPWVQIERFSTFTCDQIRKELERRSAEIRTHRPLNADPAQPITELEWLEYDGRHLGK